VTASSEGEGHGSTFTVRLKAMPSTDGSPDGSMHTLEHGFDYQLVKPVDQDHLARLITDAVEGS